MRILVALDGSPLSELALKAVAPFLKKDGGEAVLARVISDDDIEATYSDVSSLRAPSPLPTAFVPTEPLPRAAEDRSQAIARARAEVADYLQGAGRTTLQAVPFTTVTEVADHAAEGIVRLATEQNVDLIAVGTHGRSGLTRTLMGSVAEEVVRQAAVPVLVVREGMKF